MTSTYYSYLLRIWQSDEQDEKAWLASLEMPGTHTLIAFQDLDQLQQFLRNLTTSINPDPINKYENSCK